MQHHAAGWLSSATLDFLAWAFSTRFYGPDLVIEENVPASPIDVLVEIMCERGSKILKSVCARVPDLETEVDSSEESDDHSCTTTVEFSKDSDDDDESYTSISKLFCPTGLGIPSFRPRRYSGFALTSYLTMKEHISLEELFFKNLAVGPEVYMSATPDGHATDFEFLELAPSHFDNLDVRCRSYRLDTLAKSDVLENKKVSLTKICQTESWGGSYYYEAAPTLLKNTTLYDHVTERHVWPLTHWLVQGFPVGLSKEVTKEQASALPFSSDLIDVSNKKCLTARQQKKLTGNSMHWSACGAWYIYCMACTNKEKLLKLQGKIP